MSPRGFFVERSWIGCGECECDEGWECGVQSTEYDLFVMVFWEWEWGRGIENGNGNGNGNGKAII